MKLWFAYVTLLLGPIFISSAAVDRNGNGMSDVWEMIFNAGALAPGVDSDGDGFTNAEESRAGTNPFDSNSFPRLRFSTPSPNGTQLSWDTVPGKRYTIQSRTNLSSGAWTNEAQMIADGSVLQTNLGVFTTARFLRLSIDDVDSDGDGVADYEELALGFKPGTAHSDRNDQEDLARITNGLGAPSVITVSALDPLMFERWPDPGLVAVRRSGGLLPLTVNFALGGTATPGVDYTVASSNSVVIPAGVREVWLEFQPVADADDAEPTETISVTLQPGAGYSLGAATAANLTLANETSGSPPNPKSAARFLLQAAFGPDSAPTNGLPPLVTEVMSLGFAGWIDDQFNRPVGHLQPWVDWALANANDLQLYGNWKEFSWWGRAMGTPTLRPDDLTTQLPDPLRQRVAFALSEILVVSDQTEQLAVEQVGVANYYDVLLQHAFGNFHDLLYDVARHPAMGIFLSSLGNQKADPANHVYPDENFAREVMQLFSIGLWQLNPDGTQKLDVNGQPVPTYDNSQITELARVFTGFSFGNSTNFALYPRDFTLPMNCFDAYHDCGAKTLLGGLQLPARTASPGNTGTAGLADLDAAVSNLFVHPNVGPFIGRQLIQRLVTSNPGTGYVARVSAAFADNGAGVRGDMRAVVKAILLDPEARDPAMMSQPGWGKLREPFLRVVNFARAFNAGSPSGYYPLDQFALAHLQDPMKQPTVFNFFLPDYSPPGPLITAGLAAPEFQIINASTAITGPNYFWNAILNDLHPYGTANPDYAVRPDITRELSLLVPSIQIYHNVPAGPAADPDALLRRLDLALTGGTLSPREFQIIREAMLRIGTTSYQWHRARLRLAVYLIMTSPDFNVLR